MDFYEEFNKKVSEIENNFTAIYDALDLVTNKIKELQDIIANDKLLGLLNSIQQTNDLDLQTKKLLSQIKFLFEEKQLKIEELEYLLTKIQNIAAAIEVLKRKDKAAMEITAPALNLFYFVLHTVLSTFSLIDKEFSMEKHREVIENYIKKSWNVDIASLPYIVNANNIIRKISTNYIFDADAESALLTKTTNSQLLSVISQLLLTIADNGKFGYAKKIFNNYLNELSYIKARVSLADAMKKREAIVEKIKGLDDPSVDEFFELLQ
jgi:hypothetical protein